MTTKTSRPIAYILIRVGQLLLCAAHLYVCSALVFYFVGNDIAKSDYAMGYRRKREAMPGRGGGGGGSYSGGSGSGGGGGGSKSPTDPQMPLMLLLGVSVISLVAALVSLSTMLCVRFWQKAMVFSYKMDMFLFVMWVIGMAILAKVMEEYEVFNKTSPHAVFFKATLGLSIVLLLAFLVTCIYSRKLRIKPPPAAVAGTPAAVVAPSAAPTTQGYVQVPDAKYVQQQPPIPMQQFAPPYRQTYQAPSPSPVNPPLQQQQPQQFQQPQQPQQPQQQFQQPQQQQQTFQQPFQQQPQQTFQQPQQQTFQQPFQQPFQSPVYQQQQWRQ
ncbi:hypothetical protein BZA05DRAFT_435847 [Tricharina praecox]|uniref:uncharacterized protein n=1 Tax=Tricharina praecox TaxID=43433 RepID=UPI00221FF3DB|nr:uncharacterized protein BZA05DRAFT_435847 [Tricharina praecox]KAI5853450.1 hypothetical protein BZA05DRAFT_435847 [Tricharina praecox]